MSDAASLETGGPAPAPFPWTSAGLLFLLAYGLSLLSPNAVYWDDWTIVDVRPSVFLETYRQVGSVFNVAGYLNVVMLAAGPWAYHLLSFALMFSAGVALWSIVKTCQSIRRLDRILIVLLFLTLPFDTARVALIMFPTAVSYAAFFWAWRLLVTTTHLRWKIASLVLFFVSFGCSALLLFYVLPMLHMLFRASWRREDRRSTFLTAAAFTALPIVFWTLQSTVFRPYGDYTGYNKIDAAAIVAAFPWFVAGLTYTVMAMSLVTRLSSDRVRALCLIPVGLWIVWLAMVPYAAVGKVIFFPAVTLKEWYDTSFFDWNSRHQVLMPLGAALAVVAIDRVLRIKGVPIIAALAIAVGVAYNVNVGLEYRVDWIKQLEIMKQIGASDEVRRAKTIVMYDTAPTFSARERSYRFYEYNGWLKRVFGDETRFALDFRAWKVPLSDRMADKLPAAYEASFTEANSASQYVRGYPDVRIDVYATEGWWQILRAGHGGFLVKVVPLHHD